MNAKSKIKTKSTPSPVIEAIVDEANNRGKSSRYSYRSKNTEEQNAAIQSKTVTTEPKNHIMLKQVFLEAHKLGIPNHRVMKAMGGHRGLKYPPLNDNWKGVYYKRSWYLPKACLKDLPKLAAAPKKTSGPKPKVAATPAKSVSKPAKKGSAKAEPKTEPMVFDMAPGMGLRKATKTEKVALKKTPPGTPIKPVRDSKGKILPKIPSDQLPGVPVVLKKAKKSPEPVTADGEAETEAIVSKAEGKPAKKGSTKLSTDRTTKASVKPKSKAMKRVINDAGIPVMELVDQE